MKNPPARGGNISKKERKTRYLVVYGGVISGLGKGLATSSIGRLLEAQGYKVGFLKYDPYLNEDAGTLNPFEHGEVFVTEDGLETDLDMGNYERFTSEFVGSRKNSLTRGKLNRLVGDKERKLEYNGQTVDIYHQVEEAIDWVKSISGYDFLLLEVGGTVGERQQHEMVEATRLMKQRGEDVKYLLLTPILEAGGEQKTKPSQEAILRLRGSGIDADFILGRGKLPLTDSKKKKLSINCGIDVDNVFSAFDESILYRIPLNYLKQDLDARILHAFNLVNRNAKGMKPWNDLVEKIESSKLEIKIGLVGKYAELEEHALADTYKSVIESLRIAGWHHGYHVKILPVDSEKYEKNQELVKELKQYDGVVVPGGFGKRGIEGKIKAIEHCRNEKVPFLGLCLGLQLAVVEYARNVCDLKGANSTEFDSKTRYQVIDILPEQRENLRKGDLGGSMRLGSCKAQLKPGSSVWEAYGKEEISERHRHRYEVNKDYVKKLTDAGLVVSGINPQKNLVEFIELPKERHPFFVATQAHPEFKARFLQPAPIFTAFIKAAKK